MTVGEHSGNITTMTAQSLLLIAGPTFRNAGLRLRSSASMML